jgi:hypothetical protein
MNETSESSGFPLEWKSNYDRSSHEPFLFHNRNWSLVQNFWSYLLATKSFPSNFYGDETYGITNLRKLEFDAEKEFNPKNSKSNRKTFAFVLAYDGTKYFGYQQQNEPTTKTVEDDLDIAFGRKLLGAGRTDKDVSALSQVISFSTFEDIDSETLLTSIRASEPFVSNRLAVWDCIRLPRKFHPVFCATWRRYLYLFPVTDGIYGEEKIDVDIPFINRCLERSVFLHSFRYFSTLMSLNIILQAC